MFSHVAHILDNIITDVKKGFLLKTDPVQLS